MGFPKFPPPGERNLGGTGVAQAWHRHGSKGGGCRTHLLSASSSAGPRAFASATHPPHAPPRPPPHSLLRLQALCSLVCLLDCVLHGAEISPSHSGDHPCL